MTKAIYKYRLPMPGGYIALPAQIVPKHVAYQDGMPTLWAEVVDAHDDTEAELINVHCFGTGWHGIPDAYEYIGTLIDGGGFVWHFYHD